MTAQFQTRASSEKMNKALALYAVLARDVTDFIDMAGSTDDSTLGVLYEMLATPNNEMATEDVELNEIGAALVGGIMTSRGIPLPAIAIIPNQHTSI